MHSFIELIDSCIAFTLPSLNKARDDIHNKLQTGAETTHIKATQMVNLHKAIMVVGIFSMFDAWLQDTLYVNDDKTGFIMASDILKNKRLDNLNERFLDIRRAINILKHGKGKSYNELLIKVDKLPFNIITENEICFLEGDVTQISSLIEVDDSFIQYCNKIIHEVAEAIDSTAI